MALLFVTSFIVHLFLHVGSENLNQFWLWFCVLFAIDVNRDGSHRFSALVCSFFRSRDQCVALLF